MPQLDSLRALAILGVVYHHWLPVSWRCGFPTEVGLFYFFVLSGFLMARSLLHQKNRNSLGVMLKDFHLKRLRRIYPAYYAALFVAALFGSAAVLHHPLYWMTNMQNFLIEQMGYWPESVSHFWTLAVEQQYYLFWPLVILLSPRRGIIPILLLLVCVAPLSRYLLDQGNTAAVNLNPLTLIDDFAIGSLLAVLMHRGVIFPNRCSDLLGVVCLCGYVWLYCLWKMNLPSHGGGYVQQTLLAVAFASLIARAATGRTGVFVELLENPLLTKLGQMSFGIYLFHNLAPMVAGKFFWFMWSPRIEANLAFVLRLPFYFAITWALTLLCEKYLERKLVGRNN